MGVNELSAVLWRERELLELLTFKLEEEQLLLTAGKSRWIEHATREVEQVLDRLRTAGLERTVEVAVVAEEWGTEPETPLRELVAHAPDGPWADIFTSHLRAMTELTVQIKHLRDENEQFLRAAARSTQETLATATSDPAIYDASGTGRSAGATGSHFFDGRL
ncbi:flagellar biosynthesis protein FlgN [Frondihabitans sp. PAMC 28766]|uniref:flagellar protein FlgN n=1 Tax=Frondihabitans sp. PAMC 28766 TaxID=1795630 RepID=UPI00078E51AC|nr:flagellar protein FlgN [Frondihabitans sp. PAMC 28766]AMM19694.1 flagellar biosynthesis protein FlgN [Frondihabitans sp. PAMC 28766]